MELLWSVLGVAVAVIGLRDVFQTLWRPTGQGTLSHAVSRTVWRAARRAGPRAQHAAGPLVLVLVLVVWAVVVILGWGLVYWAHLPEGFRYGTGLSPGDRNAFLDGIYLSAVVLGTLGLGDIVPSDGWLRLVTAAQALVGFSLLTAGVSWILQIQGALLQRRALAAYLGALERCGTGRGLPTPTVLEELAREVCRVHTSLRQSSQTYYFRDHDGSALARRLPFAERLCAPAGGDDPSGTAARETLGHALDDLAGVLSDFVPGPGPRSQVFARYARDQGHG